MSIHIITGLTGSGKTYAMTRMAQELTSDTRKGWSLYANYHLNKDGFSVLPQYFENPLQFLTMEKAIVLIDDAGIWFGARQWSKLPWEVQHKIINNRKDGIQVFVTTQFFDNLDRTFRENCHKYWEANKVCGSDEEAEKVWGWIRLKRYMPRDYDKIRRRSLETRNFLIRKQYCDLFDTFEKIAPKPFDGKEGRAMVRHARNEKKRLDNLYERRGMQKT